MNSKVIILLACISSTASADPTPASIIDKGGLIDTFITTIDQFSKNEIRKGAATLITNYPNYSDPEAAARDDAWRIFRSFTTRRK